MEFETSKTKVVRVMNAVAAGTTPQNGSIIDMAGFEGVRFIAAFGALTATQVTSLKVQQGAAANLSDAADLAGSKAGPLGDGDGNGLLITEIFRPQERYVRCVVSRGTANAVIDGVIAELYGPRVLPVAKDATVIAQTKLGSPAEGTA